MPYNECLHCVFEPPPPAQAVFILHVSKHTAFQVVPGLKKGPSIICQCLFHSFSVPSPKSVIVKSFTGIQGRKLLKIAQKMAKTAQKSP